LVESHQKLVGETEHLKNEHFEFKEKYESLEESHSSLKYKHEELSANELTWQQNLQDRTNELN